MQIVESLEELHALSPREREKWYIPESLSTAYPVNECGEVLLSLPEVFKNAGVKVLLDPVSQVAPSEMYMRQTAALLLVKAASTLAVFSADKLRVKVKDAFRPLELQRKYFSQIEEEISAGENISGEELWLRTTQFIADPDLCPPHCTGGAIDCTLVDMAAGKELDMGTSVDAIDDQANTFSSNITKQAGQNRQILFKAMVGAGFVNLPSEWWHFSYGDQYWAAHLNKPAALYGVIETPPNLN